VAVHLARTSPGEAVLCSVVVGELLFGALRSKDVAKNVLEARAFVSGLQSLPLDDAAAEQYAKVRADLAAKGTMIGPNDLLIAAIALTHQLTLITHNTGEFSRVVGLTLEDWQV
jgi:tRNA(fMet)-specific endonuclease VapC